jgi:hypothetical protein
MFNGSWEDETESNSAHKQDLRASLMYYNTLWN